MARLLFAMVFCLNASGKNYYWGNGKKNYINDKLVSHPWGALKFRKYKSFQPPSVSDFVALPIEIKEIDSTPAKNELNEILRHYESKFIEKYASSIGKDCMKQISTHLDIIADKKISIIPFIALSKNCHNADGVQFEGGKSRGIYYFSLEHNFWLKRGEAPYAHKEFVTAFVNLVDDYKIQSEKNKIHYLELLEKRRLKTLRSFEVDALFDGPQKAVDVGPWIVTDANLKEGGYFRPHKISHHDGLSIDVRRKFIKKIKQNDPTHPMNAFMLLAIEKGVGPIIVNWKNAYAIKTILRKKQIEVLKAKYREEINERNLAEIGEKMISEMDQFEKNAKDVISHDEHIHLGWQLKEKKILASH